VFFIRVWFIRVCFIRVCLSLMSIITIYDHYDHYDHYHHCHYYDHYDHYHHYDHHYHYHYHHLHHRHHHHHYRLRVVLQTLYANITGDPILLFRNVTIETDPRLGVVDIVSNTTTTTTSPARATIGGSGTTVEGLFRISDNAHVLLVRVYVEGGVGGRGGCFYVSEGTLLLNDVILRRHVSIQGGAIYLEDGGRASMTATNST
jgi:hypothetical protein